MCNENITVEILEKAIIDESAKKGGWFNKKSSVSPARGG